MPAATNDTIVAVSSPPGRSRRGVIRLSGPGTKAVLEALSAKSIMARPRALCRVRLDKITSTPLPALAWFSPGPGSYTGEDLAEIQLPGNPALLDRAVRVLTEAGARHAEAGEFTFRAYLAGKLDLTEAEGIHATISAVSDSQLAAAGMLREGQLGSFARSLVDSLGQVLALTEAGIDFIDQDDVSAISARDLHGPMVDLERRLEALLKRSRSWGAIEALPRVVLVGPPSSGKSTLFNALLGQSRAVIDETAGTTRDVLAQPMTLTAADAQPVEIMLVDMAGLDQPTAALDHQAQDAANTARAQADLLILFDEDLPSDETKPTIRIHPKADLERIQPSSDSALPVSAISGQNMDTLRTAIIDHLGDMAVSVRADMLALQPRHESTLREALAQINEAKNMVDEQASRGQLDEPEMLAATLRAALDELESLGGRLSPDQVIGRIFANFCVGK